MSASLLLEHLAEAGVALVEDNGRLKVRGAKDVLTEGLLGEIRENKDALLALLAAPANETGACVTLSAPAVSPSLVSALAPSMAHSAAVSPEKEGFSPVNAAELGDQPWSSDSRGLGAAVAESTPPQEPVFSSYVCRDNSELIAPVMRLYGRAGMRVADVTWGKGVFWKRVDLSLYDFHKSDLLTVPEHPYDFRALPYDDESFDILAIDPPYAHNGPPMLDGSYKGTATTRTMNHNAIRRMYCDGLKEALRVVKKGGLVLVKCQDEIESGEQCWSHIEIFRDALELGFYGQDLINLHQAREPYVQYRGQQHSRRRHSYLWVFRKPQDREVPKLRRRAIWEAGHGQAGTEKEGFGMHFTEKEMELIAQVRKTVWGASPEPQVTDVHREDGASASKAVPSKANVEKTQDEDAESRRVREECRRRWSGVSPLV